MFKTCPNLTSRRTIGSNIAARRRLLNMTQGELAIAIGYSRHQLGRIERGEYSVYFEFLPTLALALKLSDPLLLMKPEAFDKWI